VTGETDRQTLQLFNTSNAVLATVLVSTCVASFSSYVVVSKALGLRDAAAPAPVVMSLANPAMPMPGLDIDLPNHGAVFADGARQAAAPALPAAALPEGYTRPAPLRVIAGRPPVLPLPRPAVDGGIIRTARGVSPAQLLGFAQPQPRPAGLGAAAAVVQTASLRPPQRPVTLSTRSAAPEQEDQAVIQQAAATAPRDGVTLAPARSGPNPCSTRLTREMPRRPGSAAPGSAVMASLEDASGGSRDNALIAEAMRGNMPSHMRALQPVRFSGIAGGRQTEIVICVTPDYLAVGSDTDNVRVPLGLPAALRVADAFDMMLPTPRMVDAIYQQADLRLSPQPMTPGAQMSSTNYFVRHDATLDAQMASAGARDGVLVAGHKKDVVIANRLARAPGRVAIYGWHRTNGRAIQSLSTVHGEYYADYSHGIRLVSRTAYRDGRPVDLRALLTDGQYAGLLNNDGPLSSAAVRLASLQ
jgi:hypothetical protein